jgi:hypothetical protein
MSAVTGNHNNRSTQMSEQAALQSIARSGYRKNFLLICRAAARTPAASYSRLASGV